MTVRTRIAPSPTGSPHVGTAYVALFNFCFARACGGRFILRIEDTDQARSSAQSEAEVLAALRWLNLTWDEGPDVGGDFGPYRQSERTAIYREHAEQLLAQGHAFRCFCSQERLAEVRRQQQSQQLPQGYDGACLELSAAEVQVRLDAGTPHVVRMRVPTEGSCLIQDELRGSIEIKWQQVDMQVLLKANGMPTYHLANVVDDHHMEITHVIRGEEWINSAPKHLKLYEYFGWQPPVLCHLPLLRNTDKSKLSKRKHPTSINYYRDTGILPEALLNYLALMGWSMPDEREYFSLEELIAAFNIEDISLGGPVFDIEKLHWLSGQWLRGLSEDEFMRRFLQWLPDRNKVSLLLSLLQQRTESFGQILPQVNYLLGNIETPAPEKFSHPQMDTDTLKKVLQFSLWHLAQIECWERDLLQAELTALAARMELKTKVFLQPLFLAVSGRKVALPLFDSLALLGKDLVSMRLNQALASLGGWSKKEHKVISAQWRSLSVMKVDNPSDNP